MFRVKICGITSVEDARLARDAGADAIGVNFYPASPRCVSIELAKAIREAASGMLVVGVFVNATEAELLQTFEHVDLDALQLHGDEPPDLLPGLGDRPIIRARRMDERGVEPLLRDLSDCVAAGRRPDTLLVDAAAPGVFGGTGKTIDWDVLADSRERFGPMRLVLAGGLNAGNVAQAVALVRPSGVDTASGVESSPGVKDAEKLQAFVAAAQPALGKALEAGG